MQFQVTLHVKSCYAPNIYITNVYLCSKPLGASVIKTPIIDIPVDNSLRLELIQTGEFSTMSQRTDEMEHSGEMQYPFIAQICNEIMSNENTVKPPILILPLMIGATSQSQHFGHLLAPILSRSNIFTVISTDFCHWGSRFDYSPTNAHQDGLSFPEIHEFIEWLDRLGMDQISLQDPGAFAKYIKKYKNTIWYVFSSFFLIDINF